MDIKLTWKVYLMLVSVALVSATASVYLGASDFLKDLFNVPAIGALCGIVIQIFRDQAAFERNIMLQQKQQDFSIGVTSHMANVTFDKHVEFCEKYMKETKEGFIKLMGQGPTPDAAGTAIGLKYLRLQYDMWISPDVHKKLEYFEQALFDIGMLTPAADETPAGLDDVKMLEEARRLFDVITGERRAVTATEKQIVVTKVTEHLREVLGINELFVLRQKAVADAIKRIQ